jgi:hypothetical protein
LVLLYETRKGKHVERNILADLHDDLYHGNKTVLSYILFKYACPCQQCIKYWKSCFLFCLALLISLPITRYTLWASCNVPDFVVRIKQRSDFHKSDHYQISWNPSNGSPMVHANKGKWHFTCDTKRSRHNQFVSVMHENRKFSAENSISSWVLSFFLSHFDGFHQKRNNFWEKSVKHKIRGLNL